MRVVRVSASLLVLALLHIHLHHRFTGPPFDYVGLAAGAAASWIGLPGPGEPLLIAAGILAAQHKLAIGPVVFVAFLAAAGGGLAGWILGRWAGRALLVAPGPFRAARVRAADRGERIFARYPVIAIILTPSWVAGINRVRGAVYHPTNVISAAIWAAGIGFGAYFVGPPVVDAVDDLGTVMATVLVVIVAAVIGIGLLQRHRVMARRERQRHAADNGAAPSESPSSE